MKKIICVLMSLVMIVSLVSCGNSKLSDEEKKEVMSQLCGPWGFTYTDDLFYIFSADGIVIEVRADMSADYDKYGEFEIKKDKIICSFPGEKDAKVEFYYCFDNAKFKLADRPLDENTSYMIYCG